MGQSLHPSGCESYVAEHYTHAPDKRAAPRGKGYDARALANHRIWAPWRSTYIKGSKPDECIFCAKPALDDEEALIVRRGERSFVMLNAFPYTSGHVMVAPYAHVAALQDLDEPTSAELVALVQQSLRAIDKAYRPEGYNVGANLGTVAGAGVADHFHMHVVPRWEGDTNFMPVLGDTRVLPESLDETFRSLKEAFAAQVPR
jgi:ATP adenylyltransferase